MSFSIKVYFTFLVALILIDTIYILGLKKIHSTVVQKVQGSPLQLKIVPALLFYAIAPLAYIYFIQPLSKDDIGKLGMFAGIMGLLMYGTFDFTNLALFSNYPIEYALMDTTWGIIAITLASLITHYIHH